MDDDWVDCFYETDVDNEVSDVEQWVDWVEGESLDLTIYSENKHQGR